MSATAGAEQAGRRAVKNTGVRAAGEIVGKLSTLLLFAVLAREVSEASLGVFIFAFAFLGIALIPVGFGTDPYMLRQVARARRAGDREAMREALDGLFFNVVALKLAVTVPVVALGAVALLAFGYSPQVREVIAVMGIGLLLDVFAKSFHAVFTAYERSELLALSVVAQRILTAALGVGALLAGAGLVTVAWIFTLGSAVHLGLGAVFMRRAIGMPRVSVSVRRWRAITVASFAFAVQDVFTVLLFKLDAVLLSLIATEAAVGRYGSAYRLLESTLFVTFALNGAFVAMYAYLGRDTEPTIGDMFGRSLKAALVLLVPGAVLFAVLPEEVCSLIFGPGLADAGPALRYLAPVVVLISVVTLCSSLIVSRRSPKTMVPIAAAMVALNVALNLLLVPGREDVGAAMAMLFTEIAFVAVALLLAARLVGGVAWEVVLAGPLLAGAAMAAAMLALRELPLAAAVAGGLVYPAVLAAWERARNPADFAFVRRTVVRRLPGRAAA